MKIGDIADKIIIIGFEIIVLVLAWWFLPRLFSVIATFGLIFFILVMRSMIKEGTVKTKTPTIFWLGAEYMEEK